MTTSTINFEALDKAHWSAQDRQNVKSVLHFVQRLMNEHQLDRIEQEYILAPYKQHNRSMQDGISGLVQYFQTLIKRFPEFSYEVKQVLVDGNLVTLHSHATVSKKHRGNDKKGFNIIDTWRIEDGILVEHWDAVQPLDGFMRWYYWMTGGAIRNNNGVFR
ncbi:nuclear transport factor 2 family protein [Aliiglaciecola sp. CAU 1673]|uniref:nuclear transport factor 2 family protein n=1 Tax=Aliiglaciecola sp. CAU 1673 TaxID=3032595 RepID=UPI0023DB446F|nr:nuclear transport factor 2 family protein [Aliiglaciecola sp. CAU 1673]MDF2176926.1 nuclear transport factor 2 family protein [Aliiglaciecola sp. CAU 1673]